MKPSVMLKLKESNTDNLVSNKLLSRGKKKKKRTK